MSQSISITVQHALELATESYDIYLARTLTAPENAQLRHAMEADHSDNTSFSTQQIMNELDAERKTLSEMTEHVHDVPQLQEEISSYIRTKIDELYYENNDLRTAQMKREHTNSFVVAVSEMLTESGRMSDEQAQVLRHLLDVYDMSIIGAVNLQSMVHRYSHGQTRSLIEWAQTNLQYIHGVQRLSEGEPKEDTPVASMKERGERSRDLFAHLNGVHKTRQVTVKVTGEEVSQHARELFRFMLDDMYDLSYVENEYPHPAIMQLVASATLLAGRQVANRLDPENPKEPEAVVNEVTQEYRELLKPLMGFFQEEPNQLGIYNAYHYLDQQRAVACNVPEDFEKHLSAIHKKSVEQACQSVPRVFRQWQNDTRVPVPASRTYLKLQSLNIGTLERTDYSAPYLFKEFKDRMETVQSIEGFVALVDEMISHQAYEVAYAANEPSLLLVMKEYVLAMEAGLVQMQRKAGNDTSATRTQLGDLAAKCDLAYESYRIAREWCLESSDNAYDNPGVEAMMHVCATTGKHFAQLSKAEQEPIPEEAARIMRMVGREQGLDNDLAENPFMPLLYERCMDLSAINFEREHREDGPLFSDRVAPQRLGKRAQKKLQNAAIEDESTIRAMAHVLLDNVVAMFPGGEMPELEEDAKRGPSPWRDPDFHAAGLKECMNFFDEAQERGRLH